MAHPLDHQTHTGHAAHDGAVTRTFHTELACVACAESVERALRANPHVTAVHVDYPTKAVHVTTHAGMVSDKELAALISAAAHGCRCAPEHAPSAAAGGSLAELAHGADMAAVTMNTAADRMQYEFPATAAGKAHDAEHGPGVHAGHVPPAAPAPAAPGATHAGHPAGASLIDHTAHTGHAAAGAGTGSAEAHGAHGGHAGMGHDMSDPRMAGRWKRT